MINNFFGIFTTALIVTAVGIALRPGSQLPSTLSAWMNGIGTIEHNAAH